MSENIRLYRSFIDIALHVIRKPTEFFKQMPKKGGFRQPVIFLAVTVFLGFFINLIGIAVIMRSADAKGGVIMLLTGPIVIILLSFVSAGILFIIWRILGSRETYETSYRCMAYSSAILPVTSLISFIPFAGVIISTLWAIYLIISASVNVHNVRIGLAWAVWVLLGILFIGINFSVKMDSRHVGSRLSKEAQKIEKMQGDLLKDVNRIEKEAHN